MDYINRRSSAEQTRILKDLKDGAYDIIVGTHRLVSKDVVYKRSRPADHRRRAEVLRNEGIS
ncbi:MAG: hypothetical protein IPP33_12205 [Flavobacteriales bacterium]|nr:hypothetical protein [Flavobacteriales bacterium]